MRPHSHADSRGPSPSHVRAVLLGSLLLVSSGCASAGPCCSDQRVGVDVWSTPPGAQVFFVPEQNFDSTMVDDPQALSGWEIQEGPTNVTTRQYERSYAVVFICGGALRVLRDVHVVFGYPNEVGTTLPVDKCDP